MRHDTKQGIIVIIIFFGPLLLMLAISGHNTIRSERKAFHDAMVGNVEKCYASILTNSRTHSSNGTIWLTKEDLIAGFDLPSDKRFSLKSLVPSNSVWVSLNPVNSKSTNLACVVRAYDGDYYGIEGNGNFRQVPETEFANWQHVSAQH